MQQGTLSSVLNNVIPWKPSYNNEGNLNKKYNLSATTPLVQKDKLFLIHTKNAKMKKELCYRKFSWLGYYTRLIPYSWRTWLYIFLYRKPFLSQNRSKPPNINLLAFTKAKRNLLTLHHVKRIPCQRSFWTHLELIPTK